MGHKNGIYLAIHMSANGKPYYDRMCGENMSICTTVNFATQKEEAERFMHSVGASQIYWFQLYPYQIDRPNIDATQYIQNYGFLVCSE